METLRKKGKGYFNDDYYNLIIAILLIVIFFFLMKIGVQYSFKELFSSSSQSVFMKEAISQAFPASRVNTSKEEKTFTNINRSLISSIFRVDIKNPITYAQAQFPASYLYKNNYGTRLNGVIALGEDEKPVIYFTNYDGTEEIGIHIEDVDDLGELGSGGVYLIDDSNIIDSIDNNDLNLANVVRPKSIKFEKDKPQILIYHTHGTESYYPASEGNYHSLRKDYTVIKIAEIMSQELEARGFKVIHDSTLHDYPSYGGSYSRSLETARKILERNTSIKVVLDIHRDGFDNIETSPSRQRLIENNTVLINGEVSTRFQFVIGPDTPNRIEVENFAKFVKAVSDSKYPGFSKPILVKNLGRYNQFLSNYYGLLEVGSNANTIEQAERTAVYLADVLATSLELLSE